MKLLFVTFLLLASRANAGFLYTKCFTEQNLGGSYQAFDSYVADLSYHSFDNVIDSVQQTGMWVYYDNYNYNLAHGTVYFVHGIDIAVSFPFEYTDMSSSLRYIGNTNNPNMDTLTLYEGTAFTGVEFYTEVDSPNVGALAGKVSSLVITGTSPWTIYSGEGYTGDVMCIYLTDHDQGVNGEVLDFGIYPDIGSLGAADNSIFSVRRGCWGKRVAKVPKLKVEGRQKNGAWGYLSK